MSGLPTRMTYGQVCKSMKKGNWTLERAEDKARPYAFNYKNWIAFDGDTSLKIKVITIDTYLLSLLFYLMCYIIYFY